MTMPVFLNFFIFFPPDDLESKIEDIYDNIFDNEVNQRIDWQDPDSESENLSATLNLSFVVGLLMPILAYSF